MNKWKRKQLKRVMVMFLTFTMTLTSLSLNGFEAHASSNKKVKSVSIVRPETNTLALKVGSSYQCKTKISPSNASNKKLKFQSSKSGIVSVTSSGKLKAKKTGTATITVISTDGSKKKATIKVTVVKKLVSVKKITLKNQSAVLYLGANKQMAITTIVPTFSPNNATVKKANYVSSNSSVAVVNSKGVVTAKKEGTCSITVYAADGQGKKAKFKVTVNKYDSGLPTPVATVTPTLQPTQKPSSAPTSTPVVGQDMFTIAKNKSAVSIYLDDTGSDYTGLDLIAKSFAGDVNLVADVTPSIVTDASKLGNNAIIAGSIGNNKIIDQLIADKKIDVSQIKGKWETYKIQIVENPVAGVEKAIVVVGSDKRGTIYGIYHISELMGVSPWYYWGDAAPEKKSEVTITSEQLTTTSKEPSVKYRGIFLNDEAPSLDSWVKAKFGDFNEKFYQNVYELILRLKGNYLWPAMWSAKFSVNGTDTTGIASAKLANDYGIVMGTSHHEPMMRAGAEWQSVKSNYGGNGEWNYATNKDALDKFWEDGVKRNGSYDNLITLGMRGEADSAMLPNGTVADNVNLLKDIITSQKSILNKNNLSNAPKILTLYKEVEGFWYGSSGAPGLKDWNVLDDVTIMLTEDNFGNVRTLPTEENRNRSAGWGMYYHFDYHGGPRSYEWVDTIQLEKVWEQMSMAYDYGVQDVWIVNVGDLKPMELPTSYFLDMAYDFDKWGTKAPNSTDEYTKQWVKQQFGKDVDEQGVNDITSILEGYTKLNASRKPEIVNSGTYSITNYNEAMEMLNRANSLITLADKYKGLIPATSQAAYYQLVYYPAVASANVTRMQIYSGLNTLYYNQGRASANVYATLLQDAIQMDVDLQNTYNKNMPGVGDKWKGMMSSAHVGYVAWDSSGWKYPEPKYLQPSKGSTMLVGVQGSEQVARSGAVSLPEFTNINQENYYVDVANAGGDIFNYTVTSSADWINVTKTSGTVSTQDTFGVSIDYSKVTSDQTGTIVIASGDMSVTVNITAKVQDVSGLSSKTFVEAHNYVSINAEHYANNVAAADGSSWKILNNLGKTLSALKVYPTTKSFTDSATAPYLEYKVMVTSDGSYTLQNYFSPSNNVSWDSVSMKYGVSVDGGSVTNVDTIDGTTFVAGNSGKGAWGTNVMEAIRTAKSNVTLTKGVHTIRIYAVDPALVLQKLVLYRTASGLPASYFGPGESYYVGKTVESNLVVDVQPQKYVAPCNIPANTTPSYDVIVPKDTKYEISVTASYTGSTTLDVKWNNTTVGQIAVSGDGTFTMPDKLNLAKGKGTLSFVDSTGLVTFTSVNIAEVDTTIGFPLYIRSSSEQAGFAATNVYDKENKTSWKASESDATPYLEFDFDNNYTFDNIALSEVGSNVKAFEIRTFDGDAWKTIYTGTNIVSGEPIYLQGKSIVQGQKVRIVFTNVTAAPVISEVALTPFINWAVADKNVKFTGVDMSGNAFDVPASVNDGDRITKCLENQLGANQGSSTPHTVTMEFGEDRTIDKLDFLALQEAEKDSGSGVNPNPTMLTKYAQAKYIFSYYDATISDWVIAGTVSEATDTNRKVMNMVTLDKPVVTKKVKVDIYTNAWTRIVEFEAIQTKKATAAENFVSTKATSVTPSEVVLSEACKIGKIQVKTASSSAITYETYNETTNSYETIEPTAYDTMETEDGQYMVLAKPITSKRIRVTSSDPSGITNIELWGIVGNGNQIPDQVLLSEDFELSKGNVGNWASAAVDVTTDQSYEGSKSLVVASRTCDWSCMTIPVGNILGKTDTTTEYTLTCYIKSASGTIKVLGKFCDTNGQDKDQSSKLDVNSSGWTKFEYKFKMTADNDYIKIQTDGDTANTSYYVDSLKITKPSPACTCNLTQPSIANAKDIKIPMMSQSSKVQLVASSSRDTCQVQDHSSAVTQYTYSIISDPSHIATLQGDSLTVTGPGTIRVKAVASVNGYTRFSVKEFTVTKLTEVSDDYKDWAKDSNGALITKGTDYINVSMQGKKEINKVSLIGLDNEGIIPDLKIYYLKDGEWVAFPNGTVTGNTTASYTMSLDYGVITTAVRVEMKNQTNINTRTISVEAYGNPIAMDGDICEVGTPTITNDAKVDIPTGATSAAIKLSTYALAQTNGCTVTGHEGKEPTYTYQIVKDTNNISTLVDNVLTFNTDGEVTIGVTATLNGQSKSSTKVFTINKEGYVNWALATNGGAATASDTGNGSPGNVIDGNRSYSNSLRWRTTTYPAWVEIDFAQQHQINLINLFSQQESGNIDPTTSMTTKYAINKMDIQYWDGTSWVTFTGGSITSNNKVWFSLALDAPVTTSKIRVNIPTSVADGWARIVELEAWGY